MSAKLISELHVLSLHASCLQFSPDYTKVMCPNPAFVPKVSKSFYSCPMLELFAFNQLFQPLGPFLQKEGSDSPAPVTLGGGGYNSGL